MRPFDVDASFTGIALLFKFTLYVYGSEYHQIQGQRKKARGRHLKTRLSTIAIIIIHIVVYKSFCNSHEHLAAIVRVVS